MRAHITVSGLAMALSVFLVFCFGLQPECCVPAGELIIYSDLRMNLT